MKVIINCTKIIIDRAVSIRNGKPFESTGRKVSGLRVSFSNVSMAAELPKHEILAIILVFEDNYAEGINNIIKYLQDVVERCKSLKGGS